MLKKVRDLAGILEVAFLEERPNLRGISPLGGKGGLRLQRLERNRVEHFVLPNRPCPESQ